MRILDEDLNKPLDKVLLYLTISEASELKESLENLINRPLNNHAHITNEDFEKELTVCIYDVDNLKGFNARSIDLIVNDK
jgi:GGDEF domain-containing protein